MGSGHESDAAVESLDVRRERDNFFALSADLIVVTGQQGRLERVNPAASRAIGYPEHELMARSFFDFVHPDDREKLARAVDEAGPGVTGSNLQLRLIRADGAIRWFSWNWTSVEARSYCIGRDITEQKRMQDLERSQQEVLEQIGTDRPLQEVLDSIMRLCEAQGTGVCCSLITVGPGGKTLQVTSAPNLPARYREALVGFEPTPVNCICGATIARRERVVVPDVADHPLTEHFRPLLLELGLRACWSTPILTPEGEVLGTFVNYHAEPRIPTPTDDAVMEVGTRLARIALMRERAQAELRLLRKAVESLSDAVIVADADREGSRIRFANEALERITGFQPDGSPGGMRELMRRCGLDASMAARVRAKIQATGLARERLRLIHRDGREVWVDVDVVPMIEGGELRHWVATARDVTEHKAIGEHLAQTQKMEAIGRLAGGVAHDFNNILTAILTYCRFGLDATLPADPVHQDLREIAAAGERAADLTRQLLAFSRQQVLEPQPIRLGEAVENLSRMLRRLLGADVTLVTETCPDERTVFADPSQLDQVLMNLAVNARDAMPGGGTLRISVAHAELPRRAGTPAVRLTVSDTGTGIEPSIRSRIFEPFFTTKGPGKGTGLGLATVLGIVEQSGGSIDVVSAPGSGTAFHVYLPAAPEDASIGGGSASARAIPRHHETILLVEDEATVRRLCVKILSRNGYHVLEAADGVEALAIARSQGDRIQVLVTDLIMPRMGGAELARTLRQQRPELRVLFMSGYSGDSTFRPEGFEAGTAFLQKPFVPEGLLGALQELVEARG